MRLIRRWAYRRAKRMLAKEQLRFRDESARREREWLPSARARREERIRAHGVRIRRLKHAIAAYERTIG